MLLSTDQIDKILRVVEAFGLDFYTDALEPDYARLASPTACSVAATDTLLPQLPTSNSQLPFDA